MGTRVWSPLSAFGNHLKMCRLRRGSNNGRNSGKVKTQGYQLIVACETHILKVKTHTLIVLDTKINNVREFITAMKDKAYYPVANLNKNNDVPFRELNDRK